MSKLPDARTAGACLHITSLPGRYGIGEIGAAARRFIDALHAMDMRVWQFLPVGATGGEPSPYQPLSIYAGNALLIDIAALVDDGLLTEKDVAPLAALPSTETDYEQLVPLKTRLLSQAASRFITEASTERRAAFDEFVKQNNKRWLHNFALFEVLRVMHGGKTWPEWDVPYVNRNEDALHAIEAAEQQRIIESKVLQFLFYEQWQVLHAYARQKGVLLFGDVPIYIPLDSADAWETPALLQIDRDGTAHNVAGVPPDYFSEDGQLWGSPLYDWNYHARTGYRWWIARMRHAMGLADVVRLDHFRAFESYWSIPAGSTTAREGKWVAGAGDALFAALRAELGELPIVAEDLGMITEEVNALRERQQFPGMKVLQFLLADDHFDASQVPWNSVCYTATHDNDTTASWSGGDPIDIVNTALRTRARMCIILVQDLLGLGSEARMNVPGTSDGNWRWRLQVEQINDAFCAQIREMVVASGRNA